MYILLNYYSVKLGGVKIAKYYRPSSHYVSLLFDVIAFILRPISHIDASSRASE